MIYSINYTMIKSIKIYNKNEMITYEREVIRWEEYLGGIAGMYDLLLLINTFIFGGFIEYLTNLKWITAFYKFKNKSTEQT